MSYNTSEQNPSIRLPSPFAMPENNKQIEDLKSDSEIQEIVEIARLAKVSKESAQSYEDKTRPIIVAKDYGQEIKVVHYTH